MVKSRKKSASDNAYMQYIFYIIDQLIENHCAPSYATQESMRKWYFDIPYSDKTMSMLIEKSILFIRTLNAGDSNSTDPHFLNSLTDKMADYLSGYMMRGDHRMAAGNADKATRRLVRDTAKEKLKEALFTNCRYIRFLFAQQKAKRDTRAAGQGAVNKERTKAKKQSAKEAYKITCQIRAEFVIMQNIPRKQR